MASATATADSKALMGFSGFSSLNFLRQIGLMLGLAASVAVGFAVVLWSQEAEYRPLYDQQQNLDAASIIGVLDANQIEYKMEPSSGMILVDANKVHDARMKLSASGISGNNSVGLELLDKEQTLGTSQFVENARYRRGLEGELARTISSIQSVRNARVHLAIPKSSVFLRDRKRPRASVFLELYGSRNIGGRQVKAIRNMVASAIPEMKTVDVSIVDQHGNLLSSEERANDFEVAAKQLEYSDTVEQGIKERVASILTPIVGAGNFKTEVTANLDFTEIEQTDEKYNPEQASVRSEQSLEELKGSGAEVLMGGVPGALTNQPPEDTEVNAVPGPATARDGAAADASPASKRSQSVRNYELDRTISHTKHQFGKMQRLSVAVVIDNTYSVDPETEETTSNAWSPEQLAALTQLVKDTVGFDEVRGDSVNVLNQEFVKEAPLPELEAMAFYQQPWFESVVKQVLAALFVLILVFAVLRPILHKLAAQSNGGAGNLPAAGAVAGGVAGLSGDAASGSNPGAASSETTEALLAEAAQNDPNILTAGGEVAALPGLDGSFEQQMDTIRNLIQEDPNRVAQVVRKWVADSE